MKVLIYMPFSTWIPHLGTDLEIAAKHLDKGDEVHIIQCSGDFFSCEPNPSHNKILCAACKYQCNKGLSILNLPERNRHTISLEMFHEELNLPVFESVEELKSYEINGIDIGAAVASTLISKTRDTRPDMVYYRKYIHDNIIMANSVYRSISYHLQLIEPDVFYMFNGRFASMRPALRASQSLGIKTFVHERAGVLQKYILIEDTYPHDIVYQKDMINDFWNNNNTNNTNNSGRYVNENLAKKWFEDRRRGKDQSWYSFTKSQRKGELPNDFDFSKRNISIYISSEDEFEAIDDWENPLYENQNIAIKAILEADIDENIHFYLRVHPHLKGLDNTQTRGLSELYHEKLTIIPADSKIDSYELMQACEKIITFGSTMGIESAFWNKASILVGRAAYENLGSCYKPSTHIEFINMINAHLPPLSYSGAIKYGFFQSAGGISYKYFDMESLFGGRFKDVDLNYTIATKAKIMLHYFLDVSQKAKHKKP